MNWDWNETGAHRPELTTVRSRTMSRSEEVGDGEKKTRRKNINLSHENE